MGDLLSVDRNVYGTVGVVVLDGKLEKDDPWKRGYTRGADVTLSKRTFSLKNFREDVFGSSPSDEWSYARSAQVLKKFGFTAVKFDPSRLINNDEATADTEDFDDLNVLEEVYFPEVKRQLLKLTGGREVFITNSIVRRSDATEKPTTDYKAVHDTKPTHLGTRDGATPSAIAHTDYTPLGARAAIRRWRPDITAAAEAAGIIDYEDKICQAAQVNPEDKESSAIINDKYNADGKPGPRYAVYSVWRPLRTVTRDPLVMAPRRGFYQSKNLILAPYNVKVLASPAMTGDFLREMEVLGVPPESEKDRDIVCTEGPQWYYLAEQKPDEATVFKFFDSAALGEEGPEDEAGSVPHTKADIGEAAYGRPRASIEVRCIVIW